MRKILAISILVASLLCLASQAWARKIVEKRGGKVKVVKYDDGGWELLVDGKPYFIKGVVFNPCKIGEDPSAGTMHHWMSYDDNKNGLNDLAFETWVDANRNNKHDADEKNIGDFELMKEMGVNTIRVYHLPTDNPAAGDVYKNHPNNIRLFDFPVDKNLLRKLYNDYGIRVMVGNFLGSWIIGSGATWEEGTDYTNPKHLENMRKSVKAMVLDHKDEPYVLMWVLGNENNIADWSHCNAKTQMEAYARFIEEIAQMIHKLDPEHPVAICDGDDNARALKLYAQLAPAIDILSYNAYRGMGFGSLWQQVKMTFDRPVFLSEFGAAAYQNGKGEDEEYQKQYLRGCWRDIVRHSAAYQGKDKETPANSLGGTVFHWTDQWYLDGDPAVHNPGTDPWSSSPDGIQHEEWYGLLSMGDGSDWLMRQPRKAYGYFTEVWNKPELGY